MKELVKKILRSFGYELIPSSRLEYLKNCSRILVKVQKLNDDILAENKHLLEVNRQSLDESKEILQKWEKADNLASYAVNVARIIHDRYSGELIAMHEYTEDDIKEVIGKEMYKIITE